MKSGIIKTIIALIFLAIFNVIFFFSGIQHSDANWVSYGFITFAYICLIATPLLAKGAGSAILEGSLWLRGMSYFFTELVVGAIFMIADPESCKWPLIVQGILLAVFVIMQLMSVLANDATAASLQKQKDESFAKQMLVDMLQAKVRGVSDTQLKSTLNRCLDALTNTPIQTFPEALDADLALQNAVATLCNKIDNEDEAQIKEEANKMMTALQNRNMIIKRCRMK